MPERPLEPSDGKGCATRLSLIDGLKSSDRDAWDRLIQLYKPLLRHWTQKFGMGQQDFKDVEQEVYRVVVAKIATFQLGERLGSFRAWLRGIVRNICLERSRAANENGRAVGGTDATAMMRELPDHSTDEDDPTELVAELLRRTISLVRSEFSDRDWQVFERLTFEDKSAGEVAAELELSVANVRKIKSRIYRRLREELGEVSEPIPLQELRSRT
jgi:RNA polymerase sigma-70 factor (ECF subfamily)